MGGEAVMVDKAGVTAVGALPIGCTRSDQNRLLGRYRTYSKDRS
jgi:hypothetical protein